MRSLLLKMVLTLDELVDMVFSRASVTLYGIGITLEDRKCLEEKKEVNDTIIEVGIRRIKAESSQSQVDRCHVFDTFFYNFLTRYKTCFVIYHQIFITYLYISLTPNNFVSLCSTWLQ